MSSRVVAGGGRSGGGTGYWIGEEVASLSYHADGSEVSLCGHTGDDGRRGHRRLWVVGCNACRNTRHAGLGIKITSNCGSTFGGYAHGEFDSLGALDERVWLSEVARVGVAARWAGHEVGGSIGRLHRVS